MSRSRRRRSRFGWAVGALAPWCLGTGLSVSFSASAGIDISSGGQIAALTSQPAGAPDVLIPDSGMRPSHLLRFGHGGLEGLLAPASLRLGPEHEFRSVPDEIEPRADLKRNAGAFPTPETAKKGDPIVGLRPTFDAKYRQGGGVEHAVARPILMFDRDFLAFDGFERSPAASEDEAAAGTSTPGAAGQESASPGSTASAVSPDTGASGPRLVSGARQRHFDGATPRSARAVALSSSTPAGSNETVLVVSAANPALRAQVPAATIVQRAPKAPDYASLIEEAKSPAQRKCLAEAIYFEARSESEAGQAAVAQVVLNRAMSGLYPASVCGVVYQNRHRYMACQFSFACEGKSLRITDQSSWSTAVRIADEVLDGRTYLSGVGSATHYHATYVRPGWSRRLIQADKIGTHIFYRLKPGQT